MIDDGSTDNTKQILEDWVLKDSRIKYFYSTKSQGPSYARNIGIQKAKGDFILFLDADDIIEKEKLSSHVRGFEKDRFVDIIYGEVRYFKENDKENLLYSLKPENKPWMPQFYGDGSGIVSLILKQNIMAISSPLVKKKVFDLIGGFDEKLQKLEDWELFQRMAINNFKFKFVEAAQSLVLIRQHSSSLSYNVRGMRSYLLPILEKHFISSSLNIKNRIYISSRILEEYTDTAFSYLIKTTYPPLHYYPYFRYLLPLISIILLPFYLIIKMLRLLKVRS